MNRVLAASAVALFGAVSSLAAGCNPPNVSLVLDLPSDAQPDAAWIEIGAFPNGCPSDAELAGGLPPSGLAARVAYSATDSAIALGEVPTAKYGFAAVVRRADCGVIAEGCSNVDVAKTRNVSVTLNDAPSPDATACASGLICSNARCVPDSSGNDPNAGAGCSMTLVGAGPLPDPLDGGPLVTAPAIVPLAAGGFLIVYEEYISIDGTTQLTVQPIDDGGGALGPTQEILDGHCANETKIDAAGLVMSASGGLAVLSHPACGDDGGPGPSGFELFPLDPTGAVLKRNVFLNASAPTITLSTHAVDVAATAGRFLLAANVSGDATLLSTNGTTVFPQTTTVFGTPQDLAARVVRASKVLAIEADGPPVGDAGGSGTVARIYLASPGADPTVLGAPVAQIPASVTALTALEGRAFLLTDGQTQGETVSILGYDLGGATVPAVSGGFTAIKTTALLALDAAAAQNRVFCALEQQDSLAIAVIDGALSTTPQILRRVDLAADVRIPKSAHDGPIAIAATGTRVAVAWVAHKTALDDGAGIGGYAVFACKP
ncbi:MAG TPA: hypothetical protein VGH28_04725 [Polyangiaceae bacterium]|jgi:hypothetical protein